MAQKAPGKEEGRGRKLEEGYEGKDRRRWWRGKREGRGRGKREMVEKEGAVEGGGRGTKPPLVK